MEGRNVMDIKLDAKTILEKEFKTGMRGYNTKEVDLFLDDVIKDYQTFMKKIETLETEVEQMRKQFDESKRRPASTTPAPAVTPNTGGTNFDILQRISNLEKHVFGDKLSK